MYNPTALRTVYGECPILLQGRTSNDKILSTFELFFIGFLTIYDNCIYNIEGQDRHKNEIHVELYKQFGI